MGGFSDEKTECKGSDQLLAHRGATAAEFVAPRNSRGVVDPGSCMKVTHWDQRLKEEVVQEKTSHFKIINGQGAILNSGHHWRGPFVAPDQGAKCLMA